MKKERKPYDSDLTDAQWDVIKPLLVDPNRDFSKGGHPMVYDFRDLVDAIFYVNRTGCAWRLIPHDFPQWDSVFRWFKKWNENGTTLRIHEALVVKVRVQEGRDEQPTASIIDSQSVKGSDTVGKDRRGYDAGKKINGTKRHIAVDAIGMLLVVVTTTATMQDRDGGKILSWLLSKHYDGIQKIWADGGYAGKLVAWVKQRLSIVLTVVKRSDDVSGFVVLPRRWVVERTLSWLMRSRRLCRDYERTDAHARAWVHWSMIGIMTRRLAPEPSQKAWRPTKAQVSLSALKTAA